MRHIVDEEEGRSDIVEFTAQRSCRLFERRFIAGDIIRVSLRRTWNDEDGIGYGGPWGWGGYTARTIRRIAASVEDAQTGDTIFEL